MSERKFDVIVFGATGYTGKLVAEYMKNEYGDDESIKWAIAGRNMEKLMLVKNDLGLKDEIEMIEVDSSDIDALNKMTCSTKCVLTTVGPY